MSANQIDDLSWRESQLRHLQEHYASFNVFLRDAMWFLGEWTPSWMQYDIGTYLQHGPQDLMIQAQRGEAKSTITCIFAVWQLIHDPKHRVFIVSAGEKMATQNAALITKMILFWDILECLRPDKSAGDRTSVEAFDVHHSLKGVDKSPSIACVGITANLPGNRADLLIADDIESPKNSMTQGNRDILMTLSLEFSAIATGRPGWPPRIVYLGTPQTSESIYNTLPDRGFALRIWPGRFPTHAEMSNYGEYLAPKLKNMIEAHPKLQFGGGPAGDAGQPTDPAMMNEQTLQRKLMDRGQSSFQLNYMLNTRLMDALRYPLKSEQLVLMPGSPTGKVPMVINRGVGAANQKLVQSSGVAHMVSQAIIANDVEWIPWEGVHMQIDPAGGGDNGDETGFAVSAYANGTIYILAMGGIPGGYADAQMEILAKIAERFKPHTISIEKNYGYGAFAKVWLPILHKHWKGTILEPYVGGQKEKRIIGTLEPVIGRGALVVYESAIDMDDDMTAMYAGSAGGRKVYSALHQLVKLQNIKRCLRHDDRLDALEGTVSHWVSKLNMDQQRRQIANEAKAYEKWLADPVGWSKSGSNHHVQPSRPNTLSKYEE
ncbi:terminase large subunit [Stenotrophomonas phage vB_SmaS_P15]|uniref:Terminase large subunit n=1 Tax=Stenotrophomonas phage vB_SmaS_P15 TaxID=2894592 RepID=A0AAE8YGE2_9CAUD|nr:terminase large subunit [Stenotrophomonas phage vB_SmaS_P15]